MIALPDEAKLENNCFLGKEIQSTMWISTSFEKFSSTLAKICDPVFLFFAKYDNKLVCYETMKNLICSSVSTFG